MDPFTRRQCKPTMVSNVRFLQSFLTFSIWTVSWALLNLILWTRPAHFISAGQRPVSPRSYSCSLEPEVRLWVTRRSFWWRQEQTGKQSKYLEALPVFSYKRNVWRVKAEVITSLSVVCQNPGCDPVPSRMSFKQKTESFLWHCCAAGVIFVCFWVIRRGTIYFYGYIFGRYIFWKSEPQSTL